MAYLLQMFRPGALLALALLAAACGGQPAAPSVGAATPAAPSPRPPAATEPPAPTAVAALPTTAAPTAAPASGPTEAPAPAAIPSGRTPEGYNYLGSPDAPVVLQDFSDFL